MLAPIIESTIAKVTVDSYACRRCGRVLFRADEVREVAAILREARAGQRRIEIP